MRCHLSGSSQHAQNPGFPPQDTKEQGQEQVKGILPTLTATHILISKCLLSVSKHSLLHTQHRTWLPSLYTSEQGLLETLSATLSHCRLPVFPSLLEDVSLPQSLSTVSCQHDTAVLLEHLLSCPDHTPALSVLGTSPTPLPPPSLELPHGSVSCPACPGCLNVATPHTPLPDSHLF